MGSANCWAKTCRDQLFQSCRVSSVTMWPVYFPLSWRVLYPTSQQPYCSAMHQASWVDMWFVLLPTCSCGLLALPPLCPPFAWPHHNLISCPWVLLCCGTGWNVLLDATITAHLFTWKHVHCCSTLLIEQVAWKNSLLHCCNNGRVQSRLDRPLVGGMVEADLHHGRCKGV